MAQKIEIIATDGSKLVIEALGVLSQGDLDAERAALEQAIAEAEQAKSDYQTALSNIINMGGLATQIEEAKRDILNALPKEATEQDIDSIFEESESVSEEA